MKLTDRPVVVVTWAMHGCPACDEYLPTFRKIAEKYQRCVPSVIVDANRYPAAADHYRVKATPTTMIMRYGRRGIMKIEGAADEAEIERLFGYAFYGMDCKIDGGGQG